MKEVDACQLSYYQPNYALHTLMIFESHQFIARIKIMFLFPSTTKLEIICELLSEITGTIHTLTCS